MSQGLPIVVAGAGIGGLTAALAIARAGFRVIVCERATELVAAGAGVQLSPNAGRVLQSLGLDPAIAAVAREPPAIEVGDGRTGRRIISIPTGMFAERYGFSYRVVHRGDLQDVLVSAIRRDERITLRLETPIVDASERDGALMVMARGQKSGSGMPAAGLVGADGVWSGLRSRIANHRVAEPTGRSAWRAIVAHDAAPPILRRDSVGLWLGDDAHIVHYPVSDGGTVNVVAIVAEEWSNEGWSAPGDRHWLAERFASWSKDLRATVEAPVAWQKWAIADVDPTGPWTSGAVALLGDAAHAMVPFLAQGAAMAIEDAAVLGSALAASPDDVVTAFRAYEAARKPRVVKVWEAARRTGEHYHLAGPTARARDIALRFLGPRLVLMRNDWIYRWTTA